MLIMCEYEVNIWKTKGSANLDQFLGQFLVKMEAFCESKNPKGVLLALYYLLESIQAQKYEKKLGFELLYPSPIDVNHGAVRGPTNSHWSKT